MIKLLFNTAIIHTMKNNFVNKSMQTKYWFLLMLTGYLFDDGPNGCSGQKIKNKAISERLLFIQALTQCF